MIFRSSSPNVRKSHNVAFGGGITLYWVAEFFVFSTLYVGERQFRFVDASLRTSRLWFRLISSRKEMFCFS